MAERWSAVLARLGLPTGDGRILSPGGITNRDLPLPLMWQRKTEDGHGGSVIVGRIEEMSYGPDMVTATGTLFDIPEAAEAKQLIEGGVIGPSVDLDDLSYVMDDQERIVVTDGRIAGATLVPIPAFAEVSIHMAAQTLVAAVRSSGWGDMPIADESRDWDGDAAADRIFAWADGDWSKYARGFLLKRDGVNPETRGAYGFGIADVIDGTLTIVPRGVFAAAAAVQGARSGSAPEGADAMRSVLSGIYRRMDRVAPWDESDSVTAAAVPLPPLSWFQNPKLEGPTPLQVQDDGRVFGHVATWGTCHVGLPGCVTAPSSPSEYAYFLVGAEKTAEGVSVPVGKLTVGGGHAAPNDGFRAAAEHYDAVGTAVASVFAGEDEHGIWVAGRVVPDATEEQIATLQRSPLSGDWRRIGGNLELIAAHAVNVPGFPIPRARVSFAMENQQSLIMRLSVEVPEEPKGPTPNDVAKIEAKKKADAAKARLSWALKKGR